MCGCYWQSKMDSPNSTKSRSSRKNSFIELLKPEIDKMKSNCSKYRQENATLRKELNRLTVDKHQLENAKELNEQMYKNEISRLNEMIRELQSKVSSIDKHQLNHQMHHQTNQQINQQTKNHQTVNQQTQQLNNHQSNAHHKHHSKQQKENHIQEHPNKLINTVITANGFNDSYKQLIGVTMEDWMQRSKEKFKAEVNDKVDRVKQNFLISLEREVELIINQLTIDHKKKQSNEFDINEQFTIKISPDIKLVLKPLKSMIESINQHFSNKKNEIVNKIDELDNSQRLLESSLNRTRLVDHELQNEKLVELNEKIEQLEDENRELKILNDELEKQKVNLNEERLKVIEDNKMLFEDNELLKENESKYEEKIRQLEDEFKFVKSNLNKQIVELRQKSELNFELKEHTILAKMKKENENLVKELNNKFSELLGDLKETVDLLSPSDKKKMYDQINKFLDKFHRFANEKIKENTALFENYTNVSMSYMEMPSMFGNS